MNGSGWHGVHFPPAKSTWVEWWKVTAIPLRLAGMVVNRLARGQRDRLIPIGRAYVHGLRIGRRSPQIPTFGTDEAQGRAVSTHAEPVQNTDTGTRQE